MKQTFTGWYGLKAYEAVRLGAALVNREKITVDGRMFSCLQFPEFNEAPLLLGVSLADDNEVILGIDVPFEQSQCRYAPAFRGETGVTALLKYALDVFRDYQDGASICIRDWLTYEPETFSLDKRCMKKLLDGMETGKPLDVLHAMAVKTVREKYEKSFFQVMLDNKAWSQLKSPEYEQRKHDMKKLRKLLEDLRKAETAEEVQKLLAQA